MIQLPERFRRRVVFALAGGLLGAVFAFIVYGPGTVFIDDRMPGAIGAIVGGAVAAGLLWPKRTRPGGLMILLGVIVMFSAVVACNFSVGFFSDREVASRAAGGLGNWVGSFFGAILMAFVLSLFNLFASLFFILLPGAAVGWLFRDAKTSA